MTDITENTIKLEPITKKEWELLQIAKWRNETLISLRSNEPTPVTTEHQFKWVDTINKNNDKYFFIYSNKFTWEFIGYIGLDKISYTRKYNNIYPIKDLSAELSLLIGTPFQSFGYGKLAIKELLKYGFDKLKLNRIYIEVYNTTNNYKNFWSKLYFKKTSELPNRKLWGGTYYNSIIAEINYIEYKLLVQEGKL